MARGINKVILIGNLGNDPDSKKLPSGDMVVNLSLATSESWNDKQSGERREKTEWHRLVAFDKTAEIISQYCRKGSKIYVEGKLQTRKWQDKKTGDDRYSTEIVIGNIEMLDSLNNNDGYGQQNREVTRRNSNNQNNRQSNSDESVQPKSQASQPDANQDSDDWCNDQIPF